MQLIKSTVGEFQGQPIHQFVLKNSAGNSVTLINFGAAITAVETLDRNGDLAHIACGFSDVAAYTEGRPYTGVICGRVANRINEGRFSLNGKTYQIGVNHGRHTLHGGFAGFDKVLWTVLGTVEEADKVGVRLEYLSKDGEEGFPGNLHVELTYFFTETNELQLLYSATTDQATVLNLTNHSYFNLGGFKGTVYDHELTIRATQVTETDKELIPSGNLIPIVGTPYDFTTPRRIDTQIHQAGDGYDLNYVLNSNEGDWAGEVYHPESGRFIQVFTTEPGLQIYTANHFNGGDIGHGNTPYIRHGALALETQHFPDSPNRQQFPSTILRPGEVYHQETVYQFGVLDNRL
jgi:aldose 1-epimerase